MAAPVGIDRSDVIDAAVLELEERGRVADVGLRPVAERLGIRVQSLYAHVDGADDLRRALALRGLGAMADSLTDAAIGRAGADALAAIVRAYWTFAIEHPGPFDATLTPPGDDEELLAAMAAVTRPLLRVFESAGITGDEAVHWYRIVFASIYGFATMRRDGRVTLGADPEATIDRMIAMFVTQLGFAPVERASDRAVDRAVERTVERTAGPTFDRTTDGDHP